MAESTRFKPLFPAILGGQARSEGDSSGNQRGEPRKMPQIEIVGEAKTFDGRPILIGLHFSGELFPLIGRK